MTQTQWCRLCDQFVTNTRSVVNIVPRYRQSALLGEGRLSVGEKKKHFCHAVADPGTLEAAERLDDSIAVISGPSN